MLWQLLVKFRQVLVGVVISVQHWLHPLKPGRALQWHIVQRTKDDIAAVEEHSFITLFHREVSADTILAPLNVGVQFTDKKAVILSVPGNAYDVEKYPFFYNGVFKEATTKTTLQLSDFNRLLDDTPWPDVRLIWLWSVGRCGSTLLANLFTSFKGFRTISEPDDTFMVYPHKKNMSDEEYERTIKNSLKYHLYQVKKRWPDTTYVIIKPRSIGFWYIVKNPEEINEKTTHIFMYRDVYPVLKSFIAAFGRLIDMPASSLLARLLGISHFLQAMLGPVFDLFNGNPVLKETGDKIRDISNKSENLFVRFGFAGLPYLHALYRHLVETNQIEPHKLFAVKYERLIADPVEHFERIAAKMQTGFTIDHSEMERLVELSKQDSQKNSIINKETVAKFRTEELPVDVKTAFDEIMKATGQAGDLEKDFLLPNTV